MTAREAIADTGFMARLYRQFGVNLAQAGDPRTVDAFRTDCLRELKKIKTAWPELNYVTAQGVLILSVLQTRHCPHRACSSWNKFSSRLCWPRIALWQCAGPIGRISLLARRSKNRE